MKRFRILLLFSVIFIVSCATSGTVIDSDVSEVWEKEQDTVSVKARFFVLGNAWGPNSDMVLNSVQEKINKIPSEKNHILFLGDNVRGKSEAGVKEHLQRQVAVSKASKAKAFFVPGNYDWEFDGTKGLEVMEDYLEKALDTDEVLTPNNGCPLESIEISESIQLLVIDSQWYLENWDKHSGMNDKCEIKTRKKLLLEIEGELKDHANKLVLFAMHHPLYTNGFHGGRFSARDHLFPLQGNIPLPGIGTLVAQIRSQGGPSIQDRFNLRYREMVDALIPLLTENEQRILVVSGHEQNLQYIEQGAIHQIISGAGNDAKPVGVSDNGLFSHGGQGFAEVAILADGSAWTTFFGVDAAGNTTQLFQKKVIAAPVPPKLDHLPTDFPKTMEASVYDLDLVDRSDFFTSFWGNHYRAVYGTKVEAKVAILDTLYGGLTIERPGGGHQTKSLRLLTKEGKEYNMRALKKSATQFLKSTTFKGVDGDKYFSETVTEELILDFYTAAHPYAAFAIPTLAKAAGVYYTTPELFYVPQQKALGKYNEEYGDQLYMIVEKPSDEYTHKKNFGYPDDIESTDDLLSRLRKDEDFVLDEEAYIRARIFDMLIGDWDRHSDQWRWAVFENDGGKTVFVPIPRDRDQVFANFDGSFLNLLRKLMGGVNQLGVYGPDIHDVEWFNVAGSKLDRALVKRSDKTVWLEQARILQKALNEQIVDEAFKALPKEVQDSTIVEIKSHLLARKDNLVSIVDRYYSAFIKFQMITGTDKDDYFEITRLPGGVTRIVGYRIKDGEKGELLFDRTFNSEETNEIWLYGLDDDDVFTVTGEGDRPVLLRIIGGQEKDRYNIKNGKGIKVYDRRSKDHEIVNKGGAQFRFTNFYEANLYDYQKKPSTGGSIGLFTGYNPDTGFSIAARFEKTVDQFITNPYGRKFNLSTQYHFLTQGLDIEFAKRYAAAVGSFNMLLQGRATSKNYTQNFFGFGNETRNDDERLGIDFNRVNLSWYEGGFGFETASDYGSFFQIGLNLQAVDIIRNGANFFDQNFSEAFGARSYFLKPSLTYRYKNFNDLYFPTKGMLFQVEGGAIDALDSQTLNAFIDAGVTFYNSLLSNNRLVLKTEAKSFVTIGDRPQFYQSAQLGAARGLRSYRNERFTGDQNLLGSADLLYSFEELKTFLFPLAINVFAGYDVGRVWVSDERSRQWHESYGGGVLLKWTDAILGNVSAFHGAEGWRIAYGFGVSF
ncbi:phosphoesterase [Altibacter sp.]|uniref:phosphoesterase n=1 Tax=Altibacter sp. TaxID=2024823 RepID=UPI0025871609|nr:phosphoesterase [Altibacter sp.]MCW9036430.1 phosphoesterase [Altibacter sp.]